MVRLRRTSCVLAAGALAVACTQDFDSFTVTEGGDAAVLDAGGGETDASVVVDAGPPPEEDSGGPAACDEPNAVTFEGHCYFPLEAATWEQASAACERASAHLVTFGSGEEHRAVRALTRRAEFWIGMRRPSGSAPGAASFTWITGESVGYTSWQSGEPNGSGECVRSRPGGDVRWDDVPCDRAIRPLCERD